MPTSLLKQVVFKLEKPNIFRAATESIWAEPTAAHSSCYRLRNVPFFVYGVSLDDIVVAKLHKGLLVFDHVKEHSGHSTYRVLLRKALPRETVLLRLQRLRTIGCSIEEGRDTPKVFAIDVSPEVDVHAAYKILKAGEEEDDWTFEEGFCGHQTLSTRGMK